MPLSFVCYPVMPTFALRKRIDLCVHQNVTAAVGPTHPPVQWVPTVRYQVKMAECYPIAYRSYDYVKLYRHTICLHGMLLN